MSERKAGRDLDAEICEKIFGLKRLGFVSDSPAYYAVGDEVYWRGGVFRPSRDIAAAWQIIDWWRNPDRPGGYGELSLRCEGDPDSGVWVCQFGTWRKASASTAPLAVCLAALAAVERNR